MTGSGEGEAVQTQGLRKTFGLDTAPVRALRGVDLGVDRREFVAVMGPSGCGKSTLLNLIAGLDVPTAGEVVVAGMRLAGMGESELARMRRAHIGFVFQFHNLLAGMTAHEQVALAAALAGGSRREADARAEELLDLLGLRQRATELPGVLSGGERQRLAIARALANRPTLLLADEPTGALDSDAGEEILELFRRLHQGGQTILLVTHDDRVAAGADRIVHMRDGAIDDHSVAPAAARVAHARG
jgi:putative ABC transport system ATP-binding protein